MTSNKLCDLSGITLTSSWDEVTTAKIDRAIRDVGSILVRRGTLPPDQADDLGQETMLTLFRKRHAFAGRTARDAVRFGYGIMINLIKKGWRAGKKKIRNRHSIDDLAEVLVGADPHGDDVERKNIIMSSLARLVANQREAMVLRYLSNLENSEIAVRLGMTEGSVAVLLTRARHCLRADRQLAEFFSVA